MAPSRLLGVGEADAKRNFISASYLQAYGPDQIVAYVKPYITSIPINLWGRDFLEQTKATISLNEPFLMGAIELTLLPLNWESDAPVWATLVAPD